MLDRAHRYLTAKKAPGWLLLLICAGVVIYDIVDFIANIGFVAENLEAVSWVDDVIFHPVGLLVVLAVAVAWLLRVGEPRPTTTVTPPRVSETNHVAEKIDLSVDPLDYRNREHWVYVRVKNDGLPDDFTSQVIRFRSVEQPQTQYTVKWREGDEPVRRVFKDDLLNLAQIIEPEDQWESAEGDGEVTNLERLLGRSNRKHVGFKRGYFRLFSVTQPEGWDVYGTIQPSFRGLMMGTIPPAERPLLVFDESIQLHVRVIGTRRQEASGWVKLGFQRPEWHYDSNFYVHKMPIAEFTPDK